MTLFTIPSKIVPTNNEADHKAAQFNETKKKETFRLDLLKIYQIQSNLFF